MTAAALPDGLRWDRGDGVVTVALSGPLNDATVAPIWGGAMKAAGAAKETLRVDCTGVDVCGGAGFALLLALEREAAGRNAEFSVTGLREPFLGMFKGLDREKVLHPETPERARDGWVERIGRQAADRGAEWKEQTAFVGEVATGLTALGANPRHLRLREWWVITEKAGANALPIVALISFLMGMIMAFQAAMPMRQFGVDIFVINLVALAMTRELGPIMTAIVLAGRSGSAFAAEIGTMKVNEEVAALTTMGLNPVRFLAVPRVLAGVVVTPVLTVYSMAIGVAGGIFVMMLLGFPLPTLGHQLAGSLEMRDVFAGLIKAFFFGAVVAGVGCMRGLQTGAGAAAVGDATTRSVVTGIFLIVLLDAVFAVVYYQLKF